MPYAQVLSLDIKYNQTRIVRVEVDTSRGFHSFNLVGLAHKSISEAKDRVSAAIKNCGYISPKQRNQKILVSLAPAHIHKEGTHFDLAIALGYLKATKEIPIDKFNNVIFLGELGLNGEIRPIKHVLSAAKLVLKQRLLLVVPEGNANELKHIGGSNILLASHISDVIAWSQGRLKLRGITGAMKTVTDRNVNSNNQIGIPGNQYPPTLIQGNVYSKFALVLSVVGNHHMCLYGPAGTGKTSLVNWLRLLTPPIRDSEILEVSEIWEYFSSENAEQSRSKYLRPFRSPQHNITLPKFVGGGNPVKAGELTLAHKGILFMDEFIEFKSEVINCLREPLENKRILVHTGTKTTNLPTEFTLICATNLCNCGNYGSLIKRCYCDERLRRKYLSRIPGPIIDRIPIWSLVEDSTLSKDRATDLSFLDVKTQIEKGLSFREKRMRKMFGNSKTPQNDLLDANARNFLEIKAAELNLSGRQIANYTKLARTVADVSGEEVVSRSHVSEALKYIPRIRPN